MKNNLSYNEAFAKLEIIVEQMEDDAILLDTLTEKVREANELIHYCETKLRKIEGEVNDVMGETKE